MKELNALRSVKIDEKEGYALFSINPKIYSMYIIYSASYILMDKAYIFLDGDPNEEIIVEIRKKDETEQSLKQIVYAFNNELLNYAVYNKQSEKNKGVREAILQRILLTNDPNYFGAQVNQPKEEEEFDDPEGILKLWEESEKQLVNEEIESSVKETKTTKGKRKNQKNHTENNGTKESSNRYEKCY